MKKISHHMEESLLNYLDGKLSDAERQKVEDQLKQDETLRLRFEELQAVNFFLKGLKVEQPSKNFTTLVMNNLDQAPATQRFSLNSFLLLAGILMAIGIASLLVSSGVFDGATAIVDLNNDADSMQQYIKFSLPTFIIQGKLIMNIIIFLNVALALVVLDRVILKPFFRRRMEMR
jgi:anti-sigma factor RsiW